MAKTLSEKDKNAVSYSVRQSKLVSAARKLARIVKHADPPADVVALRTELEKSIPDWIRHHGGEAFEWEFSADHESMFKKTALAVRDGGLFSVAMPRGHGKTTILKWIVLYIMLCGLRKYVIIVAATADLAQDIIEFCRQNIMESDTLHEHYPHVTAYARNTEGNAIKARYQLRADGKSSGLKWSKSTLILPEVTNENQPKENGDTYAKEEATLYPACGAIIEGHGLTGAIRGKVKDKKSGKAQRPDFVLLDDPQTRESAESETQCDQRERIITGDVLGLAGPGKKIAAVMPCTVIQKGDLAHRFLDHSEHPEWQGETCQLVREWPEAQKTLWKEYGKIYKEGHAQGEGTEPANKFYLANRKLMDKGAVVSWPQRIRDGEYSAIQTAENLLLVCGDQFWAEYQNEPLSSETTIYNLTPAAIISRTDHDRPAGYVPDWSQVILAATDLNPSYALTWGVASFAQDQQCGVTAYGFFKEPPIPIQYDLPPNVKERLLIEALVIHGRQLAKLPCRPELWTVDAGGDMFSAVMKFSLISQRECGLVCLPSTGRAGRTYNPAVKSHIGQPRNGVYQCFDKVTRARWICFDADVWKETAQLAWLGTMGAPGACSLPDGHNKEWADQICREQLAGKGDVGGRMTYRWNTTPNYPHDAGDVMAMLYALAGWSGIGTGGFIDKKKERRVVTQAQLRR